MSTIAKIAALNLECGTLKLLRGKFPWAVPLRSRTAYREHCKWHSLRK